MLYDKLYNRLYSSTAGTAMAGWERSGSGRFAVSTVMLRTKALDACIYVVFHIPYTDLVLIP